MMKYMKYKIFLIKKRKNMKTTGFSFNLGHVYAHREISLILLLTT